MSELRERVMDENGNLVHIGNPKKKLEGEKREHAIFREKILNLESALKFKRSEIASLKQNLKEANPVLKQENINLRKENDVLKKEIQRLLVTGIAAPVEEEKPVEDTSGFYTKGKNGKKG